VEKANWTILILKSGDWMLKEQLEELTLQKKRFEEMRASL